MNKRISDVVYLNQQEGQRKFKVVYLDGIAKYYFTGALPARDEHAYGGGGLKPMALSRTPESVLHTSPLSLSGVISVKAAIK